VKSSELSNPNTVCREDSQKPRTSSDDGDFHTIIVKPGEDTDDVDCCPNYCREAPDTFSIVQSSGKDIKLKPSTLDEIMEDEHKLKDGFRSQT